MFPVPPSQIPGEELFGMEVTSWLLHMSFLNVKPNAKPDFYFRSWSGIPSNQSSINPIKLLIDDNKTITANFSKIIGTEFMNNFIVTLLIIMPLFFVNVVWLAKRRSKIYSIHHYTMLLITLSWA